MDALLQALLDKQNVAITSMYGLERSRFLLRCSFNLFARQPNSRVYHVLDKGRLVERVHQEAALMPFSQFGLPRGIELAKLDADSADARPDPRLSVCSIERLYELAEQKRPGPVDETIVIVFDVTTLESLEGVLLGRHYWGAAYEPQLDLLKELADSFGKPSIVLACNGPLDGVGRELGLTFGVTITDDCLSARLQPAAGFAISLGPQGAPMIFDNLDPSRGVGPEAKQRLHAETGAVLESLSAKIPSGGIVVFFSTYGKMVEFHNAWKQLGVFERIGVPYGRENRGGDLFKRGLHSLATQDKSVFLCSIRYHQDDDLAEMVMGQVRLVLVVGLPYPIMGDLWEARIKDRNERHSKEQSKAATNPVDSYARLLSGTELYKYRAIDFMNGIIKRCLVNGYRSKPCNFYILDQGLGSDLTKLARELGDIKEWPAGGN